MRHLFTVLLLGYSLTTPLVLAITAEEFAAVVQSPKDLLVGQTATNYVSAVTECSRAISGLQTFPADGADFFAFSQPSLSIPNTMLRNSLSLAGVLIKPKTKAVLYYTGYKDTALSR